MKGFMAVFAVAGALMLVGCGGGSKGGGTGSMIPTAGGADPGSGGRVQTQLLSVDGASSGGEIPSSWDTLLISPMTVTLSAPEYGLTDTDRITPSCSGTRCTVRGDPVDLQDTPDPDSYRVSSASTVATYGGVTLGRVRVTSDDVRGSGSTRVQGVTVRYSGVFQSPSAWGHWAIMDHSAVVLASQGSGSGSATYRVSGRPDLNVSIRLDDLYFGYAAGESTRSEKVNQVFNQAHALGEDLQWRGAATWVNQRRVGHGEAILNYFRDNSIQIGGQPLRRLSLRIPSLTTYWQPGGLDYDLQRRGNSISINSYPPQFGGKFYGPNAEEAAGWFETIDRIDARTNTTITGVFAVKR